MCSLNAEIKAGVPQGSVLGPILFLLFINDLVDEVNSEMYLFADDGTLLDEFNDLQLSINKLNNDLIAIENWADTWLVDFNPVKTEGMTFSTRRVPSSTENLIFFRTNIIKVVTSHKHLGVFLSSSFKWNEHIDYINNKCMKRLNILQKLKYKLPRATLNTLYITMIRSILEYGIIIFYDKESILTKKLESIQYKAALIVSGALKYSSYEKVLKDLGWPKISERAKFLKVSLFYKAINGLTSKNFSNFLMARCTRAGGVDHLRNHPRFLPPFGRSDRYKDSFLPTTCRLWNELPIIITNSVSLTSFKTQYKKYYFCNPIYGCNVGDRRLNVLHARFRIGFTALNNDLYLRSLCDSPLCACMQDIETPQHYFLYCPLFTAARQTLFNTISDILINCGLDISLFSDELLFNHLIYGFQFEFAKNNPILFIAIQKYISITKRFDNI